MIVHNTTTGATAEFSSFDGGKLPETCPVITPISIKLGTPCIKQADTTLLQYPLCYTQSEGQAERDLNYYAPRIDPHGTPAMTWCVFTIGYLRIGQGQLAHATFNKSYQANIRRPFAVWDEAGHQKMQNGSYNSSDLCASAEALRIRTAAGLPLDSACGADHFVTGPGGFLQAITHGYGGVSLSDDALTLRPSLPENADQLVLRRMVYLGVGLSVVVDLRWILLEALPEESNNLTGGPQLASHGVAARLGVAAQAGGVLKPLIPGQPLQFGMGATLTVQWLKSDDESLLPPSTFVVSVGANASSDERYAAEMLAEELGSRTCGQAALAVVTPNATSGRPTIAVGAAALEALAESASTAAPGLVPRLPAEDGAAALGDDGFVLAGGGAHPWLALSGREDSPRGTSYAAVELLEAVGLKFLAFDCTIYPDCPAAMPALNRTQGPPQFTYRSVYMWQARGDHPRDACWSPGHTDRFAVAGHYSPAPLVGGENTAGISYSLSATHPEWFWPPTSHSTPSFWQVCWSNRSLVEYMIAHVKGVLEKAPATKFLQISPNDGGEDCQRPLELQINTEEGTPAGSFWRAVQAIAEAIAPAHPNTKIVSLSYAWTQHPPQDLPTSKIQKMHPAVVVYFAPIDDTFAVPHFVHKSSDVHQFCGNDPNCLADRGGDYNRGTTADIERWQQLKVGEIWVVSQHNITQ